MIVEEERKVLADYVCYDKSDLLVEQEKLIGEVSTVLSLDRDNSCILLLHSSWNKEKLFEAYMCDPEKALETSGALVVPVDQPQPSKEQVLCPIMFDDFPLRGKFVCTGGF